MTQETQFLSLLRTASKSDLQILAKLLSPYLAETELRQTKVWGDRSRLHLDNITIPLNDLLLNTRSGHITIEKDCFFGHRCMLLTGTHDYEKIGLERLTAVPDSGRDIHIKQGVWLGSGVTVLGPAVIGENAVVAAGSLVVGDVPPNTIMAGHPAKIIKKIDGSNT
ncbi:MULTISPECIES: acyltransferase [unclassified Halomonas]|uniref:acyltransferase n=1 Tax=Halomonas sp. N3-2A TaxID=2014541 RepID=UPI000B5B0EBD|nr:serine acetyltransferase [Halomonas sp. N3-2A]UTD56315.1 acyltransferase [Halomonas sp. MS1]